MFSSCLVNFFKIPPLDFYIFCTDVCLCAGEEADGGCAGRVTERLWDRSVWAAVQDPEDADGKGVLIRFDWVSWQTHTKRSLCTLRICFWVVQVQRTRLCFEIARCHTGQHFLCTDIQQVNFPVRPMSLKVFSHRTTQKLSLLGSCLFFFLFLFTIITPNYKTSSGHDGLQGMHQNIKPQSSVPRSTVWRSNQAFTL